MARIAAKNANFSFNAIDIEDELNSIELSVDNNLPEVTAFADAAGVFVEGKYSSSFSIGGALDPAAAQGDATIFTQIGSGAAAVVFDPTGSGAGADTPTYTGNAFVKSYSIKSGVGEAVTYSAELQISGALARNVA